MTDLASRCEAASGAETADLLYKAWNALAQADADFRRFACTIFDHDTGQTNAGRFAELLEVGAFTDAALMLVPDNCLAMVRHLWDGDKRAGHAVLNAYAPCGEEPDGKMWTADFTAVATTFALAICAAALRAKEIEHD